VTLRRRLAVGMAFLVILLVVAGAVLLWVVRSSLQDALDQQLYAATRELVARTSLAGEEPSDATGRMPDVMVDVTAVGDDPTSSARSDGDLPRITDADVAAHVTDKGSPYNPFSATSGTGDTFRVAAVRLASGRIVVAAVPTAPVDAAFRQIALAAGVVASLLFLAFALLARWVNRLGVQPIEAVSSAARAIAAGDTRRRLTPAPPGTEAGELASAFNLMLEERLGVEDTLRRFVADAAHELRTPLTVVSGALELVQAGTLGRAERAEAIQRARSQAERMTGLVNDLLLLTKLDHELPLAEEDVDFGAMVADAVADIAIVQPAREVRSDVEPGARVRGDQARLRQVIGNLIGNVLVHTPLSAALDVNIRRGAETVLLEVRDGGPGLAPEQAAHVFDRFYRASYGRSRRSGGTGLGLSIVRAIIEAHHGRVWVETSPGRGCAFFVELPRFPGSFQAS
jgi:two-component system OmpR family sensor kinase